MIELKEVQTPALRIAFLEAGSGPTVVLLHGFPDNAWTWEHQLNALAGAGYRVLAPFLRGYPPTEIPAGGYYDLATLANDVAEFTDATGDGEPVFLVGQDWGAAISYGVLAAFPERIRRAVILAIPHPRQIRRTLRRSPKHVIRAFHWYLFQLPWLPERLLRARDFAFLEWLWKLWSPDYTDRDHVGRIKDMMTEPGALEASLAYYRALLRRSRQDPAMAGVRERLNRPIEVPTRVLCGTQDMRREMLEQQREYFSGDYEWGLVEDAGHFLHREKPGEVNRLIIGWFA